MLLRLLVKSGDKIVSGAAIAEIETEKAAFPVESPWSGTVAEVLAAGGQELAIGSPLVTLETSDAGATQFTLNALLTPPAPPFQGGENGGLYSCSETSRVLFNEKFSGALPVLPPNGNHGGPPGSTSIPARSPYGQSQ